VKERAAGLALPLDELSMAWVAARDCKFVPPATDRRLVQATFDYAYHFDAGLYARLLRARAEADGVTRHEGRITAVARDGETGNISHVTLANGSQLAADFWIDCSGFRGLLIAETLDVPFLDWSHWLPVDRALAVPCGHAGGTDGTGFTPYTRSTAHAAGWQWRIPLQHRIGNGHVFCSAAMAEDEAAAILLANLDGPALADPRLLKFTTGRRAQSWSHNVVAIGLAAGFMEPLESTSLHLVQSGLLRLLTLWPDASMPGLVRDEFNRASRAEWERIRDFLILHYHLNTRDEPFWRQMASMRIPDSLAWKIDHSREFGRLVSDGPELFLNPSWLAVHVGQGNIPIRWDPLCEARPVPARERLLGLARVMREAAAEMPGHAQFIARHCAAPAG
jgi:tryptophan halogenase